MEIIEKETVTKEKVYQYTEEELNELKKIERSKGRDDVVNYICFCYNNFTLQKNVSGCLEFLTQLMYFLMKERSGICNKMNYSFFDYLRR